MSNLFHTLKRIWSFLLGIVAIGVGVNLLTSLLQEGKVKLSDNVLQRVFDPATLWIAGVVILSLAILTFIAWRSHTRQSKRKAFDLYTTVRQLRPEDLGFQPCARGIAAKPGKRPYYEGYVDRTYQPHRKQEASKTLPTTEVQLLQAIKQGEHVLLIGPPTTGKTRTAYELLKQLPEDHIIVGIKSDTSALPEEAFISLKNKRVVVFIDDLSDYVGTAADLSGFCASIEKVATQHTIIATCRDGAELAQVTQPTAQQLQRFYECFSYELVLVPNTDEEKGWIASSSGLALSREQVLSSPTPGWIVMQDALKTMETRFQNLSPVSQDALRALLLLTAAGVLPLTQRRMEQVLQTIFNRTNIHLRDVLQALTANAFLLPPYTIDPVQPEAAYLSRIVSYVDGRQPLDDFATLGQILIDTQDDKGLNSLGVTFAEQFHDYSTSLNYFKKAHQIQPTEAMYWYNMGITLDKLERYEKAVEAYQQAVTHKQDKYEAWYNMGIALGKLERYEEALNACQQAVTHRQDSHEAWNNMAVALFKLERYEEAFEAAQKSYRLNSQDVRIWMLQGVLLAHLSQQEEAMQWLCKAWQVRHTLPDVQWAEQEITKAFVLLGLTPAVCEIPPADDASG